jgi:hypothetical protein
VEPALIGVWIALVGLTAFSYYLCYALPTGVYYGRIRAGFTALVVVLIPLVSVVLVEQASAVRRLEAHGVAVLPEARHVMGIAVGRGAEPTWVFRASVSDAAILDFYDDPTMRPGWELAERGALLRVLRRDAAEMTVVVGSAGHVIYALGSSRQTGR